MMISIGPLQEIPAINVFIPLKFSLKHLRKHLRGQLSFQIGLIIMYTIRFRMELWGHSDSSLKYGSNNLAKSDRSRDKSLS